MKIYKTCLLKMSDARQNKLIDCYINYLSDLVKHTGTVRTSVRRCRQAHNDVQQLKDGYPYLTNKTRLQATENRVINEDETIT